MNLMEYSSNQSMKMDPIILNNKKGKNRNIWSAYMFLLPSLTLITFIFFYPILKIIHYSFFSVRGELLKFVGFRNYKLLFSNPIFLKAITNNFKLLLAVPFLLIISIGVALFLHEKIKGWKQYRFILFLPYILAIPVVGIVFSYIFQMNGILNEILRSIGLDNFAKDWLGDTSFSLPTLMAVIIWKEVGFGIVLFLARMLSIPNDLYEAARIEGAGWWRIHWSVTIPELRPVIEFYLTISVITMLSWVFGYVYVMTGGGPGNSTIVSEMFIYQAAFRNNQIGSASAVSVILLIVSCVFILIQFKLKRDDEDAIHS
jgi:ABC-type sugar transport system permease subunit